MFTPAVIMKASAALLNDQQRRKFTDDILLAYLNLAMLDLKRIFQLNNIPITNTTSAALSVAAGVDRIAFQGTVPTLPPDLEEIRQLWESPQGQNNWTPMKKYEFLPLYLINDTTINQFLLWSWQKQEIKLIAANADNDLKLEYIRTIFPPITIQMKDVPMDILLSQDYLQFKTAAYAAFFIGENPQRAAILEKEAEDAMGENLQISTKGKQSISVRRRPFRAAFKMRTYY